MNSHEQPISAQTTENKSFMQKSVVHAWSIEKNSCECDNSFVKTSMLKLKKGRYNTNMKKIITICTASMLAFSSAVLPIASFIKNKTSYYDTARP